MTPPESSTVTLGLVQMRCTPDPAENMRKAVATLQKEKGLPSTGRIDAQTWQALKTGDAPVLMTNDDATVVSERDGHGNLDLGNAPAVSLSDASGDGGASAGGLQLFTNYLASTLIAPPGEGMGGILAAPPSYDTLLAHPAA
jgi:peptidoglycan hydrolase-like protein with peptidoglycan-binding domain